MSCVLCNSNNRKYLFSAHSVDTPGKGKLYAVYKCIDCNIVYLQDGIYDTSDKKLYFFEYYGDSGRYFFRVFNRIFLLNKTTKITGFKKTGKILDIGCGNGEFLEMMAQLGWDIFGVEPCTEMYDFLSTRLKGKVVKDVTDLPVDVQFDVITLWHVFEHVDQPIDLLKDIYKRLKKDGLLFIAVPNFDSFEAQFGQKRWFHLDPPRHLLHFTPETIKKIFDKTGFKVIHINFQSYWYNSFGLFQTLLNMFNFPTNFLYKTLKRGFKYKKDIKYTVNLIGHVFIVPFLYIVSFLVSFILGYFGKTGTIEVYAYKK